MHWPNAFLFLVNIEASSEFSAAGVVYDYEEDAAVGIPALDHAMLRREQRQIMRPKVWEEGA